MPCGKEHARNRKLRNRMSVCSRRVENHYAAFCIFFVRYVVYACAESANGFKLVTDGVVCHVEAAKKNDVGVGFVRIVDTIVVKNDINLRTHFVQFFDGDHHLFLASKSFMKEMSASTPSIGMPL